MKRQGFKPDLRNSAVRHYRGAWGNAAMAELGTHLVTERASLVTLRLPLARPSSIPTSPVRAIALPGRALLLLSNPPVRRHLMCQ